MSRLSIDVSPEQHRQIKAMAAIEGKSIKDLILEKIFEQDAWDELKTLLLDRVEKAKNAEPIRKTIKQITEEEIALRKK